MRLNDTHEPTIWCSQLRQFGVHGTWLHQYTPLHHRFRLTGEHDHDDVMNYDVMLHNGGHLTFMRWDV